KKDCPASGLLLKPTVSGAPTAPKATEVLSAIIASVAATNGLKPRANSKGPVTIAGAPNPAAPSIKAPNKKATIIACTRISSRSEERRVGKGHSGRAWKTQ